MKVAKTVLPIQSVLQPQLSSIHYQDGFQSAVKTSASIVEVAKAFFSSSPKWAGALFALRNRIATFLGLKTPEMGKDLQAQLQDFNGQPGERFGIFKVYHKTLNEIVIGEDDKHLDFRVSLLLSDETDGHTRQTLTISTLVKFNNGLGRLYFLPVKPFHQLMVPQMLKGIVKQLEP